jgi:hypothetical protein
VSEHDGAFLRPRVFIPFIIITLIWGSTWIVIRDQLGPVPPTWSVTYRYIIACAAMFAYALFKKVPLRVGREGHLLALAFGIPQFFLNFNFVYAAEQYITSGHRRGGVRTAAGAEQRAVLAVPQAQDHGSLRDRIGRRNGRRAAPFPERAEAQQRVERKCADRHRPHAARRAFRLRLQRDARRAVAPLAADRGDARLGDVVRDFGQCGLRGRRLRPAGGRISIGYWVGLVYLGLVASALAFTFYFGILRAVGPGRAAYSSLLVPIIAMALSTAFEDYHWSALAVAGGLLALLGLFIALRARRETV